MKELSKEGLWDECALAFNMALEKASRAYHWRYERIHQAKKQIRQLIENQPICIFCALPITEQEGACKKCANRALEDLSHQPEINLAHIDKLLRHFNGEVDDINREYVINWLQEAGVKIGRGK